MSSRGSHTSGGYDNGIEVEGAIIAQLTELNLVGRRDTQADEADAYELDQVYENIEKSIIHRDSDAARKAKLTELLYESLNLRRLILWLRGWRRPDWTHNYYFDSAMDTLMKVTELTYDGGYRKAAIVLGVVEAGAELLVLEVREWGPTASTQQQYVNGKGRNERREVRKQIASVLTNLTYGSASMKRLVAEYDGFMSVVIDIIRGAPNLVPPYANLLRNVSWPSCKGMESLFRATPALTRAAVEAHHNGDDKSVKSTLSAMWNIVGSGGEECVRRVVEENGCVDMLIELLTMDAQRTLVVEYSTGILKYASAELVRGDKLEHCSVIRARLIPRLLPLLRASSMTIVKNALCALSEIAAKDPHTVGKCITQSAMESLERLQRSNDNDIRRPAKSILSRIGAGDYNGGAMSRSAHVGNGREMSSSVRSDRLLPRRSAYCSPALGGGTMPNGVGLSMEDPSASPSHRASSLPRHFNEAVRNGGGGMSNSLYGGTGGGGQYMMGSPSPLYGNMDTIRAAAQQQAQQQHLIQLQQQQRDRQQLQQVQQSQPVATPHYPLGPPPHAIPRGFPLGGFAPSPGGPMSGSMPPPTHPLPSTSFAPPPYATRGTEGGQGFAANGPPTMQYEQRNGGGEYYEDDDEEDELSTQVTRSGSAESLLEEGAGSQDVSGFHSTVETANNSCRLSPVSYSDLPDSPTQCAAIRDREAALQLHLPPFPLDASTPLDNAVMPPLFGPGPSSSSGTNGSSGGLSSSQTHSSHTTPHATSAEQTPTYSSLNARYTMDYDATPRLDAMRTAVPTAPTCSVPSTSNGTVPRMENGEDDEDDYGVYGDDDLLDRSIQEALPQRMEEKKERVNSFLLDSLSSALPSSRPPSSKGSSRYSNTSTLREDDILAAAIEDAMPKVGSLSSPRGTLLLSQSKNGSARWSEGRTTVSTTEGQMMSERRREDEESEESEEESGYPMGGSLVGTMPRDVEEEMEAERIAIDCSSLKRKPRPPRTSLLPRQLATPSMRTARQTTPTGNGTVNGRPSPRPSSIGRPRPLTSTPVSSRGRLNKYPSSPRVSAVTLTGTPNGNSETPSVHSTNGRTTPLETTTSSSSTTSTMSRLKKPTASAVVPPYNYQSPKTVHEKKGSSPKEGKEVEKTATTNGQMLITTV